MFDLIYALFELLLASIGLGNKTAADARSEFKELFGDTTRKDKIMLAIAFVFLFSSPLLIILSVYFMSD
jgi:hypothetical protein